MLFRSEMPKSLVKHLKYEVELNEYSKTHEFSNNVISCESLEIDDENLFHTLPKIKSYIEDVIEEYLEDESFGRDLDYALALNKAIFEYIIESINEYNEQGVFAFSY